MTLREGLISTKSAIIKRQNHTGHLSSFILEECPDRKQARNREKYFKTTYGRDKIEANDLESCREFSLAGLPATLKPKPGRQVRFRLRVHIHVFS